jgi:hypothetical protein
LKFGSKLRLVVSFFESYGKPDLNNLGVKNNILSDWWFAARINHHLCKTLSGLVV